ncbi:glycoside hydrolase family 32 protein [Naasia aerilata]|uniref:Glycosyl hydrolase family 32 N-terminal domain-containing protein n=1 Tax=Naasia aerilata TaxID=1162966 RepID=A0ABM8GD17_9MICO|nr:glycoside hydrolase family 32 protein [Naasia aerilata]BDZ46155.1 hypothetical protein GCM10025866_20640 [Naasia aerilata]
MAQRGLRRGRARGPRRHRLPGPLPQEGARGLADVPGRGLADGTATALSYTSADLDEWQYEGIALERSTTERSPVWMGALWECPQIIEVDGCHVMVSSVWDDDVLHYAGYAVGRYADGHFEAESWGQLTFGPSYYAPSFFRDAEGRPCLTFWMRGIADLEAGWASAHSVPHVLTLDGDVLVATPHPDLEKYRGGVTADGALPALAGDIVWVPERGSELTITSGGTSALVLSAEDDRLQARTPSGGWSVPYTDGEVRVLLDAQVAEVSTSRGVLGLALEPAADHYAVAGDGSGTVLVRPLIR